MEIHIININNQLTHHLKLGGRCMNLSINYLTPFRPVVLCIMTVLLSISSVAAGPGPVRSLLHNDGEPVQVRVVEQRDDLVTLEYTVPAPRFRTVGYQTRNGRTAQRIELGNAELFSEPGKPEISYVPARVILPRGRMVSSVSVIPGKVVTLQGTYLLSHGEIPHKLSSTEITWAQPDQAIYNSDAVYPIKTYNLKKVQYCFGVTIAPVDIYPVTYLPKSGTLSYFKTFTLQVKTKVDTSPGTGVRVRLDRFAKRHLTEDNPGALGTYINGELRGEYQHVLCDPAQSYSYIAIIAQSFIDASTDPNIDDLIAQRELKGFTCNVTSIEDVLSKYRGRDDADKLRDFIKDAYNNWETEFVLLGGDTKIIPLETVSASNGGSSKDIPTDLPYQCLDQTSWNDDWEAEVFIGRISADDATEFSNQVFKILAYETDQLSESYMTTGLGLGEKLDNSTYGKDAMLQLQALFSSDWEFDGLYDEDDTWSKNELIELLNTSAYSNIDHLGHSNPTYTMKLRNGDETKFTNTKFNFAKSQGCDPGAFDKDCIAERFTTSTRTGMFAVVFNSRSGWYSPGNPTGGSSQKVHVSFWKACWEEDMNYFSEFNEYSHRMHTNREWDILESNLLGDPATPFRGKEVPPFLQVMSPNGGELWEQDRTFTIRWDDNFDDNVKIELLKGGSVKEELAASVPSNGSWDWDIAVDFPLGTDYKIRITCVVQDTLTDDSDDDFTVEEKSNLALKTPNGGEVIEKGSDVEITWEDNLDEEVALGLFRGGKYYQPIVAATPSNGSYTWTVPDNIASDSTYTIRVTGIEKDWLYDESDDALSIQNPTIRNFPYIRDFDDFDTNSVILRHYWEQLDDDDFDWTVLNGPTPSQEYESTGPTGDHTSGDGNYIYCEASGNNNPNKAMHVITPMFDFNYIKKPVLTFWAHMKSDSNTMGDLYIDIATDGSWEEGVIHLTDDHGDPWFENTLDMSSYEGKTVQFKFRGVTGDSWCGDICVDDFKIDGEVIDAVVITKNPEDQTVKETQTATFTVAADGTAPISYQWQTSDGQGAFQDVAGATDLSYTTPELEVSDSGSLYRCIASNVANSDTSSAATLNVEEIVEIINVVNVNKDRFDISPNPAARNGESMTFSFQVENVNEAELCVYDALGGRVFTASLDNGVAQWDLVNAETGRKVADDQYLAVLWVTYMDGTIEQITKSVGVEDKQ